MIGYNCNKEDITERDYNMKRKRRLKQWVKDFIVYLIVFIILLVFILLYTKQVEYFNHNIEKCGYNYCD
jgi:uncharacterized integral membrane protein